MGITATEAAEIARRHGLTLQDAAGLAALADSTEEAEKLASDFGSTDAQFRATVRKLFDTKEPRDVRLTGTLSGSEPTS